MDKEQKVVLLDQERKGLKEEFEKETFDLEIKGELLRTWIKKTEERYELQSTKKERLALKGIKRFYSMGLRLGKWKEKNVIKITPRNRS